MKKKPTRPDTILTHSGRDPANNFGIVNPPVYRASTVLYPTVQAIADGQKNKYGGVRYGRYGTPTTFALEEAVADMEGGYRAIALPSGLAAVTAAIYGYVKSGDHILMVDTVYGPARHFAATSLKRFGIETSFFDPMIGAGIAELIKPNTRIIYLESPGSLTFEVQDVPVFVAVAKARGITTMLDNTWASPMFYHPLRHGVDVSIIAGTKYIVGHSDAMVGLAVCTEQSFGPVRQAATDIGFSISPDDCYLALRGLRTAGVRMRHHDQQGTALAHWLAARPEVKRVLHPAMPDNPGHEFWKRDFTGSSGLFGVVLNDAPKHAVDAMLDGMQLFGMGFSWGGFESLILPTDPGKIRAPGSWNPGGPTLRIHAGLEDLEDIKEDLDAGFARLRASL